MKRTSNSALDAQFESEVRDARAGVRPYLSRKAAAWYLGMHADTLGKLLRAGVGPKMVVRSASPKVNAHQLFALADLDAWLESRKASFHGALTRMTVLNALQREEQVLQLEAEISRMKAKLSTLKNRIKKETFRG
jgi:hypothetical protein